MIGADLEQVVVCVDLERGDDFKKPVEPHSQLVGGLEGCCIDSLQNGGE
jgi:hypothetical protein